MTQDITITPFFITFDVIGGCIDIQSIYDYLKSAYKKEVFVLNANDYADSNNRHSSSKSSDGSHSRRSKSKNSNSGSSSQNSNGKDADENSGTIQSGRGSRQSTNRSRDNSRSIVKGFKARIESDLPKLIDNKRKFIAAQEKRRAQLESNKNSHKKSPISKNLIEEKPKFDGIVDVIYIITNFPYLPKQLKALFDGGIKLDAFFAFKSSDFLPDDLNKNDKNEKIEKNDNLPLEPIDTNIPDGNNNGNLNSAAKSGRSIDPKKNSKKSAIPGFSLDYLNNPTSYPPARWISLQSESPVSVSFIEIAIGPDSESTFKLVIENVIQIQKSKKDFNEFISGRRFINLPTLPLQPLENLDLTHFTQFIEDNFEVSQNMKSGRSQMKRNRSGMNVNNFTSSSSLSYNNRMVSPTVFVDAIISQLKLGNWSTTPCQKPPGKREEFYQMFQNKSKDATRKVIVYPQRKQLEPVFEYLKEENNPESFSSINIDFKKALPSVYEYLYKLIQWKLTYENMYACKSWCDFLRSPDNFHAYSGQKFDLMFQRINKTYKFGLPLNFFEWKDWSLSIEHENVSEVLESAVEEACIVDTFFDDVVGLLFVLVMKPIPRNIGTFVPHVYMPLTMLVNGEWRTNIVNFSENPNSVVINSNGTISENLEDDSNSETPVKKSRTPITPSFITNSFSKSSTVSGSLFYQLLPSLNSRFENREANVYKLPMNLTNSEKFTTPYFFEKSNMYVHIIRDCVHGKMTLKFKSFINDTFQLFSSENSISLLPVENICFFFTFPFNLTIFFYQQSICYDATKLILKTAGECPIVVTKSGDLTFMKDQDTPLIVKKDGTIGQMLQKGKWTYVNKDGETFKPRFHKKKGKTVMSKVDLPHSSFYDGSKGIKTMIRPDGFDYVISKKGKREIIFKNEIAVVQDDNKMISYDIPCFPMIEHDKENESLSLEIDKFKCVFKEKTVEIQCNEFSVVYNEGSLDLKYNALISPIRPSQPPSSLQTPKSSQAQPESTDRTEGINANCEVYITPTAVQFKSGERDVLYADADGIERKGELVLPDIEGATETAASKKKKAEYIDTHWGKLAPIKETYTEVQQMELHRIFSPRFFVVRSDLSATQYFRPDVFNLEGYRKYSKTILHPAGESINIVTYHQEEQLPFIFIENTTLSKIERVNLLKSVHIPKPPKKKNVQIEKPTVKTVQTDTDTIRRPNTTVEESNAPVKVTDQKVANSSRPFTMNLLASITKKSSIQNSDTTEKVLKSAYESHSKMNELARRFQLLLTRALARAQDDYIDDILPPPPPPKEVIRVPPQTPTPRLLEMQHNLYDVAPSLWHNANYWRCNESEFGFPLDEPHKAEQSLSPRTRLHDPPRLFKPERKASVASNLSRPQTAKKVTIINRPFSAGFTTQKVATNVIYPEVENKDILRQKVIQINKNLIDLGTVFIGELKTGEVSVKNATVKPLRYNFSQFPQGDGNSNVIRMVTIPGVIMPGLSITAKIELEAKCEDDIDTFFEFRTPLVSSKIRVIAKVVKNPKKERKKKKVKKYPDVINDLNDYEYAYEYEEEEEEQNENSPQ